MWQDDWLLTTSLSGEINYLDKNSGKVSRSINGHTKGITALAVTAGDTLFSGSYDGRVFSWPLGADGDKTQAASLEGGDHSNQVVAIQVQDTKVLSAGMDDVIRTGDVSSKSFSGNVISTGALPNSLGLASNGTTVVATSDNVQVYDGQSNKVAELDNLGYTTSTASIDPQGKIVFVGGKVNSLGMMRSISEQKIDIDCVWPIRITRFICTRSRVKP